MINTASDLDLAWLAGIVEGEGCIDLHRGRTARIRVSMTDRDVVGRVAMLFGSSIRLTFRPAPTTSTWHAEKQGETAVEILEALLPYLGARRSAKTAEVLAAHKMRNSTAYGMPFKGHLTRPPGIAVRTPASAVA